jgi:hypothetical protein
MIKFMIKYLRSTCDYLLIIGLKQIYEKTYQLIKIIKLCINIQVDENYFQSVILELKDSKITRSYEVFLS